MSTDAAERERRYEDRQRILDTAYEMFSRRAVRDVGVLEVQLRAGGTNQTFREHFPTKNDLVLAFLQARGERWTLGLVESGARARGQTAEERLLAIFDVFRDWFHSPDFDTCAFMNVLLERRQGHPLALASIQYLEHIRTIVRNLADEADLRGTEDFARSWHILMKGSIISAAEGDLEAADRAKEMGRDLIDRHR
jgi:AcrR family transcriptional regulator